ncbi:MAG: hypothetical protein PHE55_05185 [Methylococcaceae bacterium]|nr:hypothetical protein [Methylococcaceae bacterium]
MATEVFKDAKVWLAQYELTSYLNELAITHGVDVGDDTAMGDTTRSSMPGLETLDLSLQGFFDVADNAQDEIIRTRVATQNIPMSLGIQTGLENTRAYFFQGGISGYDKGGAVGVLAPFTLKGYASAGQKIINGLILEDGVTPRTGAGSGTQRLVGTVSATQKIYAVLHVLAFTGFTSVVIKVQSDTTGFPSAADKITFTTVTGLTSQYATPVAGPDTDTYWRVNWDVTGTGSISFVVAIGIK